MTRPLDGYTIGVTAARRREEFGAALERHGASVRYGPAIQLVPLADDTELIDATRRCLAAPLDFVVVNTGAGFRGWLQAADGWGLGDDLRRVLAAAVLLTRGPKARGAVRASGLREKWSPESESSGEILDHLLAESDLTGRRVAVQLHGEPQPEFAAALRRRGTDVIEVSVYRWLPPVDPVPLRQLIESTATGSIDAVAFTSAPAVTNFLDTARQLGLLDAVRIAFDGTVVVACVGAVTAAPLAALGIESVQPERGRLGALVREIVEQLPRLRGRTAQ